MKIELLHRNRFVELPKASAVNLGKNAWEISLVLSALPPRTSLGDKAEDWDEAIFALDGVEAQPALGSKESPDKISVTVVLL